MDLRSYAVLVLALALPGCHDEAPPNPPAGSLNWTTYRNHVVGYVVDVPAVYVPQAAHGDRDVLFRWNRFPVLVINYTDLQEAHQRGLWATASPGDSIRVGGRDGRRYAYRHGDGPSFMNVLSYVVEYRGRYLALEFRTEREDLDEVQQRILSSFRLAP